jgi:hypothetical protein
MKTDDLIALLSKDTAPVARNTMAFRLAIYAGVAGTAAFALLMFWLGIRPDIAAAVHTGAFWMKAAYTASLALGGFMLVERLSRPGARADLGFMAAGVCVASIAVLGMLQLANTPAADMPAAILGSSWNRCPFRILALSAPALATILFAMRRLAPTNLPLAGAAAGLCSGAIAATIYGLYCQETAAPFVAIWYTLGIALSALVGAALGSRLLRWR